MKGHPSDELLGAIARGWCSEKNAHKVMDPDLAVAIAEEVAKLYAEPLAALHEIANGCESRRPGHVDAHLNRTKAEIQDIARTAILKAEGKS